jgi:hypothetical protein
MKPSKIVAAILICFFAFSNAEAMQRHRAPVKTKPVPKVPVVSPEAEAIRNKKKVALEEAEREAIKIYSGIITQCDGAFYTKYFPGRSKIQEIDFRSRIRMPGAKDDSNTALAAERGMLTDQIYFIEMKEITDRFSWWNSEHDVIPNSDNAKLMQLNGIQWEGQYVINFKFSRTLWPRRRDQQGFNEFGTAWDEGGFWTEWEQSRTASYFYQANIVKQNGQWTSSGPFDRFTAPTCEEIKAGMPKELMKEK